MTVAILRFEIIDGLGGFCSGVPKYVPPGEQVPMTCYNGAIKIVTPNPENMMRRLRALQYIRDNFAPGLPDPLIVVKPY